MTREDDDDAYFGEATAGRGAFSRTSATAGVINNGEVGSAFGAEVDPLDAFMAEINKEIAKSGGGPSVSPKADSGPAKAMWEDSEDHVASFMESHSKKRVAAATAEDADDEEAGDRRERAIEPLPAIDHGLIRYNPVKTEFYELHKDIASLTNEQVAKLREDLRISATGPAVPTPVASFGHLAPSLGRELMAAIRQHDYHKPTAIQAQAIPAALSGRDIIGIAETGSGKTVAYLLPMLVHAIAQPELQKDDGPIGVVLCPTRELAVQIEGETFKFSKQLGLRSVTLAGGLSKLEQFKEVKRGAEIAICNPGRLIDVVKMRGCDLRRCTYVVLDEADRMFHMGFEYQMRSIIQNVRPSRQTMLFSATFPPSIEKLARDILHQPVRITIGVVGQAAQSIQQHVEVLKNADAKWEWLSKNVDKMLEKGQLLIFVKSIASAEELTQNFQDFLEKKTEFLHGDLDQGERMRILKSVRKRNVEVLIATDVAARGLDIPSIGTVVSYDPARDIQTHTHRIGRTGRAGAAGQAFTLLIGDKEHSKMAALLAESIEQANQKVSDDHHALALKHGPYRAAKLEGRDFQAKKRGTGIGKAEKSAFGLGFDAQSRQKETVEELSKRLDQEADKMAILNRKKMTGGGGRGSLGMGTSLLLGKSFVAAATVEEKPQLPPQPQNADDSDSDDDLFAPGVSGAFGKASPKPAQSQITNGQAFPTHQTVQFAQNSQAFAHQQAANQIVQHSLNPFAQHSQASAPPQVSQQQLQMDYVARQQWQMQQVAQAASTINLRAEPASFPPEPPAAQNTRSSSAGFSSGFSESGAGGGGAAAGSRRSRSPDRRRSPSRRSRSRRSRTRRSRSRKSRSRDRGGRRSRSRRRRSRSRSPERGRRSRSRGRRR
eukprot:TRINITY_DN10215_c1_g1_i1.p1 TRINITY_DN10215_c1_g1~~TRINITY_DN10215_c1_g1_i1.p1  ORF type:complete len:887 (+),score=162.60 TRINITY_DN10215_c1_g1_i1:136-2796(+)